MDTVVNEIEQKQRAERRQVREDAEVLADLMKHKGWSRYLTLVETIAQNYHNSVMAPLANVFEATRPEFAKGVLNGLTLATAIPNLKIREAHDQRSSGVADDETE
jgi:hypothetical protein